MHDFNKILLPDEFEKFIKDLFEEKLKIPLEKFKSGKDGGIDLRGDNGTLIIQCKRIGKFSDLKSIIKNHEVNKIKKFKNCKKYILVTTVDFVPLEKDQIYELINAVANFDFRREDIISNDELNSLLKNFPKVMECNPKLYHLTLSTLKPSLEKIINDSIYAYSNNELENIQNSVNKFVYTSIYFNGQEMLNKKNILIISGVPGSGKSELAKILIYDFISKGYELVKLESFIDIFKFKGSNKIFFYDDFLGGNFLKELQEKNIENKIEILINFVAKNNCKLIFTTREYILQQCYNYYGKLKQSLKSKDTLIIETENYTKKNRAKILYNHLYYSDLSNDSLKYIVKNKIYNSIIEHKNYNVRLISLICSKNYLDVSNTDSEVDRMLTILENPNEVWDEAFKKLDELSQSILISLWQIGGDTPYDVLKTISEKNAKALGANFKTGNYDSSLRTLINCFVKTYNDDNKKICVKYINPSVGDFLLKYVKRDDSIIQILLENLLYIEQFNSNFTFKEQQYFKSIKIKYNKQFNLPFSSIGRKITKQNRNEFYWFVSSNESILNSIIIILLNIDNKLIVEMLDLYFPKILKQGVIDDEFMFLLENTYGLYSFPEEKILNLLVNDLELYNNPPTIEYILTIYKLFKNQENIKTIIKKNKQYFFQTIDEFLHNTTYYRDDFNLTVSELASILDEDLNEYIKQIELLNGHFETEMDRYVEETRFSEEDQNLDIDDLFDTLN